MRLSKENRRFLKMLIYLAPPIILQEILNTSVNMLDTIMIGVKLGINEVAAVGLANQIFFLFSLTMFGVNSGTSIFAGQFWGNRDINSVHKIMGIGFTFNTVISLIFFILAFVFPHNLMGFYSKDPVVIALGARYLRIVCFSYFVTGWTVTRNSALRAIGQIRIPMFTTFVALILNFIINYILLFVVETGIEGVAIGTIISRTVEIIVQQILLVKLKIPILAKLKDFFSYNKEFLKCYLKVGMFVILNEILWAVGTSLYHVAYGYCGTEAQGAIQICTTMIQLFQVFGMSVGTACGIMLANNLGSGETELAIRYSRKCMLMSFLISVFMAGILILVFLAIINIYNVSDAVKNHSYNIMYVYWFVMIFKTINYTNIVGILRSGGDTLYCFVLDTATVWFVGVPLAFFGAIVLKLPIHGVVLFAYGEEFSKFIFAVKRVFGNQWAKRII